MAKRKTSLQAQYNKARRAVENRIRKMQERGYVFSESQLRNALPKIPKRVTQDTIKTLKKRTEKYLSERSQYWDPDSGKMVSGRRGREIEYSRRGKEGAEKRKKDVADVEALINGMRNLINSYRESSPEAAARLEGVLNREVMTNKKGLYDRLKKLNQEDKDSILNDVAFFLKYSPMEEAESAWSDSLEPILTGRALTLGDLVSDYRG